MITVKVKDIINSVDTMKAIAEKPVKGSTAFKFARLIKKVEEELNAYNESRLKIIKQYGVKKEDGELELTENNEFRIPAENTSDFNADMNKLLETEIEITADKISLAELENLELTAQQAIQIEAFVEE